jgi:Na+/melibiose symporter-like transporter
MQGIYYIIPLLIVKRIVLLAGQIADGIATPLVGYYSDKTNSKWGKRTPW